MSLNLQILVLLHRRYAPSSSVEIQSGLYNLLIITDEQGSTLRVYISLIARPENRGQWYNRKTVTGAQGDSLNYTWEKEAQ